MKNLAQLVDDLLALRRGEIAFDAVTDHVSAHLMAAPHAAEDVLRQIDSALDRKLIEPAQVLHLKTIVADTIAPFNAQLTQRIRGDLIEAHGAGGGRRVNAAQPIARSNIPLGTRLRERFVLDEVIGAGGMGTVYRGRDLLKVEARDRNPYVAIKVLNDDFRKRDDAFIVLQREASRQQRLAHPNVATVYDFDRTGDTIFISMELLEGVPLDTFLKTDCRGRGGIEWPDAQRLIEGMGAALTYAHEHSIVHADFKPSNCFLMKDGKVKVLDFGIARAIKRPNQGQSDVTVYDGASIGALTPAYASAEMLEGTSDPDPSDDVYGLACVCYELLSGKHPYNSLSAREARYQKLVPKRIERLTSRQNRALQRALAFERAARTPSVREFVRELNVGAARPPYWNGKRVAVAAVVVLLIGSAIAWYAVEYPVVRTLADVRSSDPQTVQSAIDRLPSLSESDRTRVMAAARPEISAHYQHQVRRMLDTGEIDAAYAKAEGLLAAGMSLYPDSKELALLRDEVEGRKDRYLSELAEQFERYLAAGRLLKSNQQGDIQGVMQRIRLVDPKHRLLTDPRVAGTFATAADIAISTGKLDDARALLADGTALAPSSRVLRDVSDKLSTAEQQARVRARSAELAAQIEAQLGPGTNLDKVAAVTPSLVDLRETDPTHAVLGRAAAAVRPLLGDNYESITRIATLDDIVAFEQRYAATLEALGLTDANARIAARRDALESRHDRLLSDARTLASAPPGAKTASGATLGELVKQARALAPSDSEIGTIVTAAVAERRNESQRLSAAGQWNEARAMLNAALALDNSDALRAQITQDHARIDQRQQDSARQTMLAERDAAIAAERERIATAESQLRSTLAGFTATAAGLEPLAARIAALAAIDPGNALIASARKTAAERVAAAANELATAGRFDDARSLLSKAAVDLPGATEIAAAHTQIDGLQLQASRQAQERAVVAAQQSFRTLLDRPQTADPRWQRDAEAAIAAIRKTSANDAAANSARGLLANAYLTSADQLIAEKRFTVASQMLDKAEQLTPRTAAIQTRRDQWARAFERDKTERAVAEANAKLDAAKQRFANEIKSNQLDRARRTLTELQAAAANDAFVSKEAPATLASAYLSSAQSRLRAGDFASAWRLAAAGSALQRDDPRFAQVRAEIDATANRRMEALLSVPGKIDGATVSSLASSYRANAPDRYQSNQPSWVARVKNQLADLANEPTAHNTYLLGVQAAFEDLAAIQAIRPIVPRPTVATAANTNVPSTTTSPAPTPAAPAATQQPQTAAIQQPQQASTPAPVAVEPNLLGKWCGEGVGMTFASNEYSFDLGGGRTVKYPVERYQRAGGTVTMTWTDKNLGPMVTEFGDFSADGQGMTHVRGKTAAASQWQTYNRKFRKCN
jgi:serine/threonine protein kinase